jgi:hypothetical protein
VVTTVQRISFLVGALVGLAGCDAIPGTDAHKEAQAKRIVSSSLIDPNSAQFRNLVVNGEDVCGEVNAKNKMGAFVGFTRFVVDIIGDAAFMEEDFDYSDLMSADDLCSSANEYTSASTRLSACQRAIELRSTQAGQDLFQRRWARSCGPIKARQVYKPTLAPSSVLDADEDASNQLEAPDAGDPALVAPGNEIDEPEEVETEGDPPTESEPSSDNTISDE